VLGCAVHVVLCCAVLHYTCVVPHMDLHTVLRTASCLDCCSDWYGLLSLTCGFFRSKRFVSFSLCDAVMCCALLYVLQAGAGLVGSCLGSGPGAARRFQMALEESIARHFPGNHAINCMCHSSENFYRYVHLRCEQKALLRILYTPLHGQLLELGRPYKTRKRF
jgi:hypothetical protein